MSPASKSDPSWDEVVEESTVDPVFPVTMMEKEKEEEQEEIEEIETWGSF